MTVLPMARSAHLGRVTQQPTTLLVKTQTLRHIRLLERTSEPVQKRSFTPISCPVRKERSFCRKASSAISQPRSKKKVGTTQKSSTQPRITPFKPWRETPSRVSFVQRPWATWCHPAGSSVLSWVSWACSARSGRASRVSSWTSQNIFDAGYVFTSFQERC